MHSVMSSIRLFVITEQNTTLLVECNPAMTVEEFRVMLATRPGYPVHSTNIVLGGVPLNPGLTLAQCNVVAWSRLKAV